MRTLVFMLGRAWTNWDSRAGEALTREVRHCARLRKSEGMKLGSSTSDDAIVPANYDIMAQLEFNVTWRVRTPSHKSDPIIDK